MKLKSIKSLALTGAMVLGMVSAPATDAQAITCTAAAPCEVKFAFLAPEGSAWHNVLKEFDNSIRTKSGGRIKLKIYAGGVAGDEEDVIRKLRIGQMHAAGFTGLGLGKIVPSVRVKELPFLLENYDQVDKVNAALTPKFEQMFDQKGFVYLGNAEAGFVYIMSNKPIRNLADAKGQKFWMWAGDPLAEALFDQFGLAKTPLALPDVLTSLQTGLINAVYAPPLGAVALQWFTRTKYMTNVKFTNSTGGMVVTKQYFTSLPADLQNILKTEAAKSNAKLIKITRIDNQKSIEAMKRAGIQLVEVNPAEKEKFVTQARQVWQNLVGKLYSQDLLNQVKALAGK
jgi:TRAP-type transport system periplasmic protein